MNTSIDVLEARFEAYKNECALDRAGTTSELRALRVSLNEKVSFKHFYWIIGIMVTILIGVGGVITTQLQEISTTTTFVQSDVSFLKGKLSPYEVQYTK